MRIARNRRTPATLSVLSGALWSFFGGIVSAQNPISRSTSQPTHGITAGEVIERMKASLAAPLPVDTVDTIKAGDPGTIGYGRRYDLHSDHGRAAQGSCER